MKKIMFLGVFLFAAYVHSAEPVSLGGFPNSKYDIENSSMSVASTTVAQISSTNTYRAVYLYNLSQITTIYYRIDGSTAAIPTVGYPIMPWTEGRIETDAVISLQLTPGATEYNIRRKIFRK